MDGGNLFAKSEGEKLNARHGCCCWWWLKTCARASFYGSLNLLALCSLRGRRKISRVRSRVTQEIIILISVTPEEDGTAHEKSPEKWLLTVRLTWKVRHCDCHANNTSLVHPWSASTKEKWEQICLRRALQVRMLQLDYSKLLRGWIQMSKLKRALFLIIGTQTRQFFQEIALQTV